MWKKTYALWIIEDVGRSSFFVFAHTKCVSNTALLRSSNSSASMHEQEKRSEVWTVRTGRDDEGTYQLPKTIRKTSQWVPDARWAMRNKFQWELGWKLTHWRTSCVRADVVRHKKKLVSCHKKAGVADARWARNEQSITKFNGDGVSTHTLKNVV